MASSEPVECVEPVEESKQDAECAKLAGLSKRKAKRLAKHEKKEAFKRERRLAERERKKERRRLQRETEGPDAVIDRKKLKQNTMETSSCRLRVAVDCSFDSLMAEKDVKDLGGQLARCYSINRRLSNPLQYYIVIANGADSAQTKARMNVLNCTGHWDVHMITSDGAEHEQKTEPSSAILAGFKKEEVVYLTSESPNVLETLDESKVYVIGGLVDHNTQKGLTLRLANELGIAHAQLPIAQYVKMVYRKVLTVCHVFEILVKYAEYKDWQRAFLDTIPKRHNAEPVDQTKSGGDTASNSSTSQPSSLAPKASTESV